jgi:tripartite motif-containing protein 71
MSAGRVALLAGVGFSLFLALGSPARAGDPPHLLAAWPLPPVPAGVSSLPNGLAVDSTGATYVLEMGTGRILKFDSSGGLLDRWGAPPGDDDALRKPFGIAVGPDDSVYVTEMGRDRIRHFDPRGVEEPGWGGPGTGPGRFREPRGIAVGRDGTVYVVDGLNRRVQTFSANGARRGEWNGEGGRGARFDAPVAIALDDRRVAVTDVGASRVRIFTADGEPLVDWGYEPPLSPHRFWPHAVALHDGGWVSVADPAAHEVYTFSLRGDLLARWSGIEGPRGEARLRLAPRDTELNPSGGPISTGAPPQSDLSVPVALVPRGGGALDLLDRDPPQVRRYRW